MIPECTVHVIDDQAIVRDAVCSLVESNGATAIGYESAEQFLSVTDRGPGIGCVITDYSMDGISGIELLRRISESSNPLPVILFSGMVDVPRTVDAMQLGAVTVLQKPCRNKELWDAIESAVETIVRTDHDAEQRRDLAAKFSQLSNAEKEVFQLVAEGLPNKAVASRLDVSLRTVEARRQKLRKMFRVNSVAEPTQVFVEARAQNLIA